MHSHRTVKRWGPESFYQNICLHVRLPKNRTMQMGGRFPTPKQHGDITLCATLFIRVRARAARAFVSVNTPFWRSSSSLSLKHGILFPLRVHMCTFIFLYFRSLSLSTSLYLSPFRLFFFLFYALNKMSTVPARVYVYRTRRSCDYSSFPPPGRQPCVYAPPAHDIIGYCSSSSNKQSVH